MAAAQSGAFSYISEFHSVRAASRAVAIASMFMCGFAAFGPVLSMFIIPMDWKWRIVGVDFKPWRLLLVCVSLLDLSIGVVFAFLPESPKFLLIINQKEKALQVLRRIYAFNTGKSEENYPVESIKVEEIGNSLADTRGFCNVVRLLWSQTKPIFLRPLLTHTWKVCYIEFVIFAVAHGTSTW